MWVFFRSLPHPLASLGWSLRYATHFAAPSRFPDVGETSAWRCVVGGVSAKPHVQLLVSKEGFLSLEKCINRKWVSQNLIPLMVLAVVGWWRHRRSNPSARCSNPRLRGFQLSFVTACHATTLQYLASSPLSWKGSLTSSNSTSRASLLAFDSQTLEDTWRI